MMHLCVHICVCISILKACLSACTHRYEMTKSHTALFLGLLRRADMEIRCWRCRYTTKENKPFSFIFTVHVCISSTLAHLVTHFCGNKMKCHKFLKPLTWRFIFCLK